jgi:hypothetical protein
MNIRKLLLSVLIILITLSGYSQINFGTNFRILTNQPIDTRMVVPNILSRDTLNSIFRYEGLTVYVKSTLTNYQLRGGITNANWLPISGGNIIHWDSAYGWGNHALVGYITSSSTNTLTNKSGNISMWTNDAGYLTSLSETDPIWTTASANYYTKTNLQTSGFSQLHFNNIINKPITLAGYGITDAMSTSHAANAITSTNITNWNTAFGWGNHTAAGYLTASSTNTLTNKSGNISMWTNNVGYLTTYTETDPVWATASTNYYTKTNMQTSGSSQLHFNNIINKPITLAGYGITDAMSTSHAANAISGINITNWNTAFSWGNHKTAGYLKASSDFTWDSINKRLGIGTTTPAASLSVGNTSQFQVNSSGNILKINNIATNFPSTQGSVNSILANDGNGNLSWTSNYSGGSGSNTMTTPEGGFAVYMYNGSGYAIPQYMVVMADPNHDTSIAIAPSRCNLPIGIAYDSIPNGSWGWIVVSGITYVQINSSVTRSYYAYVSSSADGQVEDDNNPNSSNNQRAVGHFLESVSLPNSYLNHGHHGHHGYHGHHGQHTSNTSHATAMIIVHFN